MSTEAIARDVAAVLRMPQVRVESHARGGNSRVYIVSVDGRRLAVKQYFRHSTDERDRLHAERSFLEFAAGAGIQRVPRVIAHDAQRGIGIYEYIAGKALTPSDITAARVREAARFFLELNAAEHRRAAQALPFASEACFSVADHLQLLDGRVARLATIADPQARGFIASLTRRWQEIRKEIASRATALDAGFERCVSPSDFGFHNALLRDSGELCFLDFEYAGWDDPAKMVCDFFSHPGLPVPRQHLEEFAATTLGFSSHARSLEARAQALLPLFQLKWCCIMMNEFVPGAAERRRFANPQGDEAAAKRRQLDKAGRLLESIG
jgi:hypothetical protein